MNFFHPSFHLPLRIAKNLRLPTRDFCRTHKLPTNRTSFAIFYIVFAFSACLAHCLLGSPWDNDPSFGTDGKTIFDFGNQQDSISDTKIQADGKIVVTGDQGFFSLVRFTPTGMPDPNFGVGGKVTTDITDSGDYSRCLAIQTDGKIVVAGSAEGAAAIARYATNGSLDPSFGQAGIVRTGIVADFYSIAIQSDGKIVAAGTSSSRSDFALARYTTNGDLDQSFGSGGIVFTDFSANHDTCMSMLIQADGKILAAGYSHDGTQIDFAIARYLSSGTLDSHFGTSGKVITDLSGDDYGQDVAIQNDGKILFVGYSITGSSHDSALVRYMSNGILDTSFGIGGKSTFLWNTATSVALQKDGKIVTGNFGGVTRYTPNGELETTFGTWGTAFPFGFGVDVKFQNVAVLPDGEIIGAGTFTQNFVSHYALIRLLGDVPQSSTHLTMHRVRAAAISNGVSGASIDSPLQPKTELSVLKASTDGSTEVSEGLSCDGVTPLLLKLTTDDVNESEYKIFAEIVAGGSVTGGGISSRLRIMGLDNRWQAVNSPGTATVVVPAAPQGSGTSETYAYIAAIPADSLILNFGSTEVICKVTVQKLAPSGNDIGEPESLTFHLRKPPLALVHGYNSSNETWSNEFLTQVKLQRAEDFVKLVDYGVFGDDNETNTYGALGDLAPLLSSRLQEELEVPLQNGWAFTRYDVVAHSQGGVLMRMLCTRLGTGSVPAFRNKSNSFRGRFHRVVTIGSPHNGSRLVHYVLANTFQERSEAFQHLSITYMNYLQDRFLSLSGAEAAGVALLEALPMVISGVAADQGFIQPKFDPWLGEIRRVNQVGSVWAPDSSARIRLIRTQVNQGFAPPETTGTVPLWLALNLKEVGRGDVVLPFGSDGVVDWASSGGGLGSLVTTITQPNLAHVGGNYVRAWVDESSPESLKGQTESTECANAAVDVLDGEQASGRFVVPEQLPVSEGEKISRLGLGAIYVHNVVEALEGTHIQEQEEPVEAPMTSPLEATQVVESRFRFSIDPAFPIAPNGRSVSLDLVNGGTEDGNYSWQWDTSDPDVFIVSYENSIVGDLVVNSHYTSTDGTLVVGAPILVASLSGGRTMTGIGLKLPETSIPVGSIFPAKLVAFYSDGSHRELYQPPFAADFQSSAPEVVDASFGLAMRALSSGAATISVEYLGFSTSVDVFVGGVNLSDLGFSGLELYPPFDPDVTSYSIKTPATLVSVSGMAIAQDSNAQITVDGVAAESGIGWNLPLSEEDGEIEIIVSAEDESTHKTYTVKVIRPLTFSDGSAELDGQIRPGKRHFFNFTLDAPKLAFFSMSGEEDLRLELLDSAGNLIVSFEGDEFSRFEAFLEAGEFILEIHRLAGPGNPQSYHFSLDASEVAVILPDVSVGSSPATLTGRNVYSPVRQLTALSSKRARPIASYATIANRGIRPSEFSVRAGGGNAYFTVSWLGSSGNSTASLVAGTFMTGEVSNDDSEILLTANIRPNKKKLTKKQGRRTVTLRKTLTVPVSVTTMSSPAIQDAATIQLKTK